MRRHKLSRARMISDLGGLGARPRRPFGVSILIVIQFLSILMIVSMDLVNFNLIRLNIPVLALLQSQEGISATLTQYIADLNPEILKSISTIQLITIISLVGIVFRLLLIFGLLWLRRWAWVLVMVQVGVLMILDLWSYFGGEPAYLSMITNVVMVFYLNQREVQLAFRRRGDRVEAVGM